MAIITKDETRRIVFYMTDETDNETPETGLTVTVQISKNGGAFATATNSVVEISGGYYYIDLTTTETNTAGPLILSATATGANDWADIHEVEDLDTRFARIADTIWRRDFANVKTSSHGDTINTQMGYSILLRSVNSSISGTVQTVNDTDDVAIGTYTLTLTSGEVTAISI